jgi:hypothetical protein
MLPHATRKDPRLQHSNEQLGHAIAIMPARIEKNKNFMNVTNRALQCCAVVKNYGRKNAKLAWTTPFVPDTFSGSFLVRSRILFRLGNGVHFDFVLPVPWMRSRRDDQSGEAHFPTLKAGLKRHAAADIG